MVGAAAPFRTWRLMLSDPRSGTMAQTAVECGRTLPGTRAEKSPQLPSKAQQEGQAKHGKHGARDHEHPPTPGIAIHLGIVKADVQGLRIAVQEEMPVGQGRVAKDHAERS